MNRGWYFGCSFTFGAGCIPGAEYYDNYYKPGDKHWTTIVSEALSIEEINKGQNSASNMFILNSLASNIQDINSGDFVVIGMTDPSRVGFYHSNTDNSVKQMSAIAFDQVYPEGRFSRYMSEREFKAVQEYGICLQGPNEKRYESYYERIFKSYCTLLNKNNIQTYMWGFSNWTDHETITYATKSKVHDRHWSYKGHRTFAEEVLRSFNKVAL